MPALRVVRPGEPVVRQGDLADGERRRILAANPDRGKREPTEAEQVLLEDLVIAIRRLRSAGWPCIPSATGVALDSIDQTVCRCMELKA